MRLAISRTLLQSSYRFSGLASSVTVRSSFFSFQTPAKNMSGVSDSQPTNGARPQKPKAPGKKEVKILMLHGYTQSGPVFRAKTRALEKLLAKVLGPASILPVLFYPTGPNRLSPKDIPGFVPPTDGGDAAGNDEEEESDMWAWFRKDEHAGTYRFFDEGMATVAAAIREAGGVDGVVGFSQGGMMAAVVAAAMEGDRPTPEGADADWARALRDANGGKALRFAVSYSGFYGPVDRLAWCYEPKIKTPTLQVLGSLDTVVEESRSQALIDRSQDPLVVTHPGGHYVPISKEWVMPLAGFIKHHAETAPQAEL